MQISVNKKLKIVVFFIICLLLVTPFTGPSLGKGEKRSYSVDGVPFSMILVEASTFPTGLDDKEDFVIHKDFLIGETPVTYQLFYVVKEWALDHGYTFANPGREGSHGRSGEEPSLEKNEPVTKVSWYDCIIWCNALSEILGYTPVYTYNQKVLRDSTFRSHPFGDQAVQEGEQGFRLPTSMEWELAARFRGSDGSQGGLEYPVGSGNFWTPGSWASGAEADYTHEQATQRVAWYEANSDVDGTGRKTRDVGLKLPNHLGLYDMSGNVWEWSFDWDPRYRGVNRVRRGGGWFSQSFYLQVGAVYSVNPVNANGSFGFRLVKGLP